MTELFYELLGRDTSDGDRKPARAATIRAHLFRTSGRPILESSIASKMNRHPLTKTLTALLLLGAFAFAYGHTLDHVEHSIDCLVCDWIYGVYGLLGALAALGILSARSLSSRSNRAVLSHPFFLSPQGRSPPAVS